MKKIRFLFIVLSLCLLLSSCASIPEQEEAGYRNVIRADKVSGSEPGAFWNNLVFTSKKIINLETGEAISICSDPLCDHRTDGCAKKVLMGADDILVSSASSQDDLILYVFNDEMNALPDETVTQNYQVLRYHFHTGEVTVLAENLPGDTFSFGIDPLTENLFFEQRSVNEIGETEYFLYILNGKTGELVILPTPNMVLNAKYMIGDVVYCLDGYSSGYYSIDLSQEELVIHAVETPEEYGDYRYYRENITQERVYVPDELLPLYEKYGKEPYQVFTKGDLYRVNLQEENAVPELVAQNISICGRIGDYIYYYEFAPRHVITYFLTYYHDSNGVRHFEKYTSDDPNVPEGASLVTEFNEYYAPIHILDADTLQEVAVIESQDYWIDPMFNLRLMGDGVFVTWQERAPEQYLYKMTDAAASYIRKYFFGYLYFNKSYLTDADTIVFDLSENEY